jgi:hypothetical protein
MAEMAVASANPAAGLWSSAIARVMSGHLLLPRQNRRVEIQVAMEYLSTTGLWRHSAGVRACPRGGCGSNAEHVMCRNQKRCVSRKRTVASSIPQSPSGISGAPCTDPVCVLENGHEMGPRPSHGAAAATDFARNDLAKDRCESSIVARHM